jgi:hypothetical protein
MAQILASACKVKVCATSNGSFVDLQTKSISGGVGWNTADATRHGDAGPRLLKTSSLFKPVEVEVYDDPANAGLTIVNAALALAGSGIVFVQFLPTGTTGHQSECMVAAPDDGSSADPAGLKMKKLTFSPSGGAAPTAV